MDLGIFDHLDRQDVPVHELYECRMRLLAKYDAASSTRTTSPSIVYCLPLYDPLRVIEEVCMRDHRGTRYT